MALPVSTQALEPVIAGAVDPSAQTCSGCGLLLADIPAIVGLGHVCALQRRCADLCPGVSFNPARRGALHSVAHDGAGQLNPITRDFLDATIERASEIDAEVPAATRVVYDLH